MDLSAALSICNLGTPILLPSEPVMNLLPFTLPTFEDKMALFSYYSLLLHSILSP